MTPLSDAPLGKPQTIVSLDPENQSILHKLMALGIMPGCQIQVEQKFPSYIITVGRSRAAFDRETAEDIWVENVIPIELE